jgi:hypothetical protein
MHGSPSREVFPLTRFDQLAAFLFMRSTTNNNLVANRSAIHDEGLIADALIVPQNVSWTIEDR